MMRLPRPPSPKDLLTDLRAFLGQRSRYQWIALALAVTIPIGMLVLFVADFSDAGDIGPQIIYVESWPANRTMEETIAKQERDQAYRNEVMEQRRRSFQRIEDFNNGIGL